jgi:hypothetical protein
MLKKTVVQIWSQARLYLKPSMLKALGLIPNTKKKKGSQSYFVFLLVLT